MNFLRLLPPILSLLILSAHFSRSDLMLFSLIFLLLPFLLLIKRKWVAQFMQVILILGAIEWVRTLIAIVSHRQSIGEPYLRVIIILGIVALITGLSLVVFKNSKLKEIYNL